MKMVKRVEGYDYELVTAKYQYDAPPMYSGGDKKEVRAGQVGPGDILPAQKNWKHPKAPAQVTGLGETWTEEEKQYVDEDRRPELEAEGVSYRDTMSGLLVGTKEVEKQYAYLHPLEIEERESGNDRLKWYGNPLPEGTEIETVDGDTYVVDGAGSAWAEKGVQVQYLYLDSE